MARKGITENEVAKAIDALKKAGLTQPSVRMIHQKLGQGSLTTIVRHKKAIEATQRSTGKDTLPDTIQEKLTDLAQEIWVELAEAADAIIDANTRKSDEAVEQQQARMEQAQERAGEAAADANNLKQELKAAEQELKKRQANIEKLEAALSKAANDNRELTQSLATQKIALGGMTKRVAKMEVNEATMKQQRGEEHRLHAQERDRWEKKRDKLQKALDAQVTIESTHNKELAVLKTQAESLQAVNNDLKRERDSLKQDTRQMHSEHKSLSKTIGSLESALAAEKRAGRSLQKEWQDKYSAQTKELNQLRKQRETKHSKST